MHLTKMKTINIINNRREISDENGAFSYLFNSNELLHCVYFNHLTNSVRTNQLMPTHQVTHC